MRLLKLIPDHTNIDFVRARFSAFGLDAAANMIRAALGEGFTFRRTEVVGPKVSGELLTAGVLAAVAAVFMIAAYVWLRFEWQDAVGAFVATGHDVFVTAGLYSLMQLVFTLTSVAALLTLAGYSVNDTVVVFDRIRENRRRYKHMSLLDLINLSTNQVLHRTLLTSVNHVDLDDPFACVWRTNSVRLHGANSVRHRGWNLLFHLRCGSIVAVTSANHWPRGAAGNRRGGSCREAGRIEVR